MTTADIKAIIIAQLEAAFGQIIPGLPTSFFDVLAKVLAAVWVILYKYIGFIALQVFVKTASFEQTTINGNLIRPLQLWGDLIGIAPPGSGTNAELTILVTVVNQTGFLPSGTQLLGGVNRVTYITLATVPLDDATKEVQVKAVNDQSGNNGIGAIGNLSPGDSLDFVNPLGSVSRQAVVVSQDITGSDPEAPEVYRQRVIDQFQRRPQGGAYRDYELWGEEVEGIISIYPYRSDYPGQVDVYVEATVSSSGSADGIPTQAQLDSVYDSIQYDQNGLASRRPVTAFVNVYPITRTGFDVRVQGVEDVDDLGAVEQDISTAIEEYFLSTEPYIPGLVLPPRKDVITRSRIAGIAEDIISAAGGRFVGVEFNTTGSPGTLETYILQQGEKAKSTGVDFVP